MASEKKNKFGNFLINLVLIAFVSYAGGVVVDHFLMNNPLSLNSKSVMTTTFIIFACAFIFILLKDMKEDTTFKGQKDMENQHFASLDELNKNFKHCKFSQLKTLSITGIPFRFELKHGDINIHFTPPCHVLIVGASGTGKSAWLVQPNMQFYQYQKHPRLKRDMEE